MPLRDHFRPPVEKKHSWDELYGGWPMMIVQQLFPILPEGYVAAPGVHLGTFFKIDVSVNDGGSNATAHGESSAPATVVWRPCAAGSDCHHGNRLAGPG